ncbi:SDR family NAD(P)-dependent oxidoreductase [Actinomadura madurae]|uniref:SDR family NAD(P)-dependent oxidoreductase n=1 Tax=Actinomadura madurae TaxID=1993 RepID=UPI002026ACB5|nr:SDR family oxidoreductase [Actinomadura madurae]MCP9953491.1 SDR family oxidoreductase [Actinomadura madurae]MCP9970252.1 SDR family oxidoreductase [Actinomadura madurae]MCP9982719.1 SDR family oxidoreductase [Actinomadura madurae]MCQ0005731.1 SDR family oxidoreductase [Actinomadura madurae]MCQ0018953.1 SDR family oxidoreductase [Actinomadura madurae]
MLLENKTAIVFGGGGQIGGAMARGFAAEGARVFLAGRTPATLDAVAGDVRGAGGLAETARVDALDRDAVNGWVDSVAETSGSVDIVVNVISHDALFGPMIEAEPAAFARSLEKVALSFLLTTQAAARHMVKQGSGVILHFGGSDSGNRMAGLGNVQVGNDMVEAMRRQWACELGPHSVRVLSMRTGGIPETIPDMPETEPVKQQMVDATLTKRAATLADVGRVAAFLASDHAASLTSTQVNISAGAMVD